MPVVAMVFAYSVLLAILVLLYLAARKLRQRRVKDLDDYMHEEQGAPRPIVSVRPEDRDGAIEGLGAGFQAPSAGPGASAPGSLRSGGFTRPEDCEHRTYAADVQINRIEGESGAVGWGAEIALHCATCKVSFVFIPVDGPDGAPSIGLSKDGMTLRSLIVPKSELDQRTRLVAKGTGTLQ